MRTLAYKTVASCLFAITVLSAYAANHDLVGKPLREARKILVAAGWSPLLPEQKPEDDANTRELRSEGYPEIGECTGVGRNYCWAQYHRGNECLSVQTQGERHPRIHRVVSTCTHP